MKREREGSERTETEWSAERADEETGERHESDGKEMQAVGASGGAKRVRTGHETSMRCLS